MISIVVNSSSSVMGDGVGREKKFFALSLYFLNLNFDLQTAVALLEEECVENIHI